MKQYLLTAGPTPVPERVLLAMARPVLYHRAPAFTECLKETQEGLRGCSRPSSSCCSSPARARWPWRRRSRTSCATGDKALVIRGGKFGERWGKIAQAYGIETVNIDVEWGKSVDPAVVAAALDQDPTIRAVYATASRDLDRRQARRRGAVQGRPRPPRRAPVRGRDHRHRRVRRADGRVGPRRRVPRLAKGADAAARAGDDRACRRRRGRPTSARTCRASTWTWRASGRARRRARPRSRRRCR